MSRHPLDGNSAAIDRHLDEIDAWNAAQPTILYCAPCDERISDHDYPEAIDTERCPNCGGNLEGVE